MTSTIENLDSINRAIYDYGATHILNFRVDGTDAFQQEVYNHFKTFIASDSVKTVYSFAGVKYSIQWICGHKDGDILYLYTSSSFPDQVVLSHTRRLLVDFITYEQKKLINDKPGTDSFKKCSIKYVVSKTAGTAIPIIVSDYYSTK